MKLEYLIKKKNKKAQSFVGFIVIAVIVIIFAVLILALIFFGTNLEKNKPEIKEGNISLYLSAEDFETKKQIPVNYLILTNKTFLSEGELDSESLIEIKNLPDTTLDIYCWDDNHYISHNQKNFTNLERISNSSKFTCNPKSAGELQITHQGNLDSTESILKFNITTDKYFNKLSAVLSWSSGIINVEFRDNEKYCHSGWTNLSANHYLCENEIETCSKIKENNICVMEEEIPSRFQNQVDDAIYTGKTLNKESYELIIYVKTEEIKNKNDYVEITFYDKDLVHVGNGDFVYLSEYKDRNIGGRDFTYKIKYAG